MGLQKLTLHDNFYHFYHGYFLKIMKIKLSIKNFYVKHNISIIRSFIVDLNSTTLQIINY